MIFANHVPMPNVGGNFAVGLPNEVGIRVNDSFSNNVFFDVDLVRSERIHLH